MKLINKDALVAEIKKLMDKLYDKLPNASKVENGTITASEICNTGKDLEEAAKFYADTHTEWFDADGNPHVALAFKAGAQWQEEKLWKPADGDDLPEIDKSALVAEIDKRKNLCEKILLDLRTKENIDYYQGKAEAYKETIDLLNTLEVKEVDLNKELSYEDYMSFFEKYPDFSDDWGFDEAWTFAQHFFELGLKAAQERRIKL